MSLTPAEQMFFATGQLQPGMLAEEDNAAAPAMPPAPPPDPLALAGVGNEPAPEPAQPPAPVQPPAPAAPPVAPSNDAQEILRSSLSDALRQVGALQQQINIMQAQSQAQPPAPPAPDKTDDPLGAMFHQLDEVNRTVVELREQLNAQAQQAAQFNTFQQFQQHVRSMRDEFAEKNIDFPDAYSHLRNGRITDLRTLGLNDQAISEVIFREETALAQSAIQQGRNPAEVIYEMSKRHGYVPKVAPPPTPDAKLTAIQKAQSAARNMPHMPVTEDISVDNLKNASNDDLNRLVIDDKAWSKLVGSDQYPL